MYGNLNDNDITDVDVTSDGHLSMNDSSKITDNSDKNNSAINDGAVPKEPHIINYATNNDGEAPKTPDVNGSDGDGAVLHATDVDDSIVNGAAPKAPPRRASTEAERDHLNEVVGMQNGQVEKENLCPGVNNQNGNDASVDETTLSFTTTMTITTGASITTTTAVSTDVSSGPTPEPRVSKSPSMRLSALLPPSRPKRKSVLAKTKSTPAMTKSSFKSFLYDEEGDEGQSTTESNA